MNTFYTHIQPNIIKFSDDKELPEKLRCRYAINYNVWGIDYFFENYLLQESNDGIYMILNENRFNFLLEDSLSDQNTLDIPRLYILITDRFLSDSSKFQEFILKASKDNEIYFSGIEGFKPGIDYFINTTLFNYLANINAINIEENEEENPTIVKLPNYIDENGNITKYFVDLSDEIIKDYTNLDYFNNKNQLLENHFSEDELNNFYQGICNLILAYSEIQNNSSIFNKPKNQIYNTVLNYYSKSQVDDASIALNLLLNSSYNQVSNIQQSCGCLNGSGNSVITESCSSLYQQAMILYLKQMFGDKEFYEDWFSIYFSEEEKFANDILIENLELFIKEFISIDYNLDFSTKTTYNCDCTDNISLNNSNLEYKKLNNFLQILDWVNNEQIDANVNKIKIYGEAFGELLPKLQF